MIVAVDTEAFYSNEVSISTLGVYHYLRHPESDHYLVSIATDTGLDTWGIPLISTGILFLAQIVHGFHTIPGMTYPFSRDSKRSQRRKTCRTYPSTWRSMRGTIRRI